MFSIKELISHVFDGSMPFREAALGVFGYQRAHNTLYRDYVSLLGTEGRDIATLPDIPFLPISFFKTHEVVAGRFTPELVFESSGTTGMTPSRHLVREAAVYEASFRKGFERFYGPVSDYVVIGLLPSYLERAHSSLAYMVADMIQASGRPESGFYLYEHQKLRDQLVRLRDTGQRVLLIGVTFALLDFAEQYSLDLGDMIIMETGGMKGRRQEWTREEVHEELRERLGVNVVHSEYGMSELLSQAYSTGAGVFRCPPWMKVMLRREDDPLEVQAESAGGVTEGLINIIDLANVHSCAFIATDDIGRLYPDGSFEVLGRRDNSDLRGCSLLVG